MALIASFLSALAFVGTGKCLELCTITTNFCCNMPFISWKVNLVSFAQLYQTHADFILRHQEAGRVFKATVTGTHSPQYWVLFLLFKIKLVWSEIRFLDNKFHCSIHIPGMQLCYNKAIWRIILSFRAFLDPLEINSELCIVTCIYLKFKKQLNPIISFWISCMVPYNDYYCKIRASGNDRIPENYQKWTKSCYFCSAFALSIRNPQITKMISLPEILILIS